MKYMGSKARLGREITNQMIFQGQIFEPFSGGFNMTPFLREYGNVTCNDSNEYLTEMFNALLSGWVPKTNYTREFHNFVKQHKSWFPKHIVGWIGFSCSYSGIWFGGYAGITQTKQGTRDYQLESYRNIMAQVKLLKGVDILTGSYDLLNIPPGSTVYCDPPYQNTTGYKDEFNHVEFWKWARKVSEHSRVYVSEYNAPIDFKCIWSKPVKSSLSANGKTGGNKNSVERLFVHRRYLT